VTGGDGIDAEPNCYNQSTRRPLEGQRRKDIREDKQQAGVYELWTRRSHEEHLCQTRRRHGVPIRSQKREKYTLKGG
jgi:hypothetical protein